MLVYGASGAVGTWTVQLAKSMGAHVTTDLQHARALIWCVHYAGEVIDYTKTDFAGGALRRADGWWAIARFVTAKAVLKPGPPAVLGGQRRLSVPLLFIAHHRRAADVSVRRQTLQDVRAGHQRC